jgi:phosphoesterase RecJ-like protein
MQATRAMERRGVWKKELPAVPLFAQLGRMRHFRTELPRIKALIAGGSNFLLLTHANPDADAIGSVAGLAYLLKRQRKTATFGLCQSPVKRLEFLGVEDVTRIIPPERFNPAKYDAVILLDANHISRLDRFGELLAALPEERRLALPIVNIDHHPDNDRFGSLNIVDPQASSTCQILVEMFGARALDSHAAACFYAGIVSDTGSFRHGKDMARVHQAAALCLSHDIDSKEVHDRLYAVESEGSLRLFGRALNRLTVGERNRTAWLYLTADDYRELKLSREDSAGIINRMLQIEGVQIAVFFNEYERNQISVSLRSNAELNVGEFAAKFGGGGHEKAAGFLVEGGMETTIDRVLKSLKVAMEGLRRSG